MSDNSDTAWIIVRLRGRAAEAQGDWAADYQYEPSKPPMPVFLENEAADALERMQNVFDVAGHLRDALEDMVRQFGYYAGGAYITGGLSALEGAFAELGWKDPHPAPEDACQEPGCGERRTCGWPTPDGGYRWTCAEHLNTGDK